MLAGEAAQRVLADLMALPFETLLRSWQRLTWWTGIWPLFRHLAALNVTLPEIVVLRLVARRPCNVAEIAQCIALSPSAASRAVDRLVEDGLIDRREDPDDRRNKRLTLTSAGAARISAVEQVFGGEFAGLVATQSPAEQEQLRVVFARTLAAFVGRQGNAEQRAAWAREFGNKSEEII
jgi:DNA-binding MarR family transcriptional regulator